MKRVIKIRVWDKRRGEYLKPNEYHLKCDFGELVPLFTAFETEHDHLIIQQSTGLPDRNGKEIYEGDILRFGDGHFQVFWDKCAWNAFSPNRTSKPYASNTFTVFPVQAGDSEVVGNIFETKVLLL